jgi:hypothetical protein
MRSLPTIEIIGLGGVLLIGAVLFIRAIMLADTVPVEYRSASPGFGWGWEYDYELGVSEAGRLGAAPLPWPATVSGHRILLPLNQPLIFQGVKMTYRGMTKSGRFRLDIGIESLDPGVDYPQVFAVAEARRGLLINDRQFVLETLKPHYLRLRWADR